MQEASSISTAQRDAIRIIRDEHDRLASVMHGMLYFVHGIDRQGPAPDLKVFRAMLFYISEYPERIHHPKEDQYLFSRLRERTSELDEIISKLASQHSQGESLARELEHALNRFEMEGASGFPTFRDLVEQYAAFYFEHMRMEEEVVLPAAKLILTGEDWQVIAEAFAGNPDPLAGVHGKDNFKKLFSMIVEIAPGPIGLGPDLA